MKPSSFLLWLGLATIVWSQDVSDPFADPPEAKPDKDPFSEARPELQADDPFIGDGDPVGKPIPTQIYQDNVGYFTEFIEIDPVTLTQILSDQSLALGNGSEVRRVIDGYLANGKASLLDSCFVSSQTGKAKLVSTAELIYPAAWDPGESFHGSGEDRREVLPKVIDGVVYWPPTIYPHPTVFEMRPVGVTLSVEASMVPSGHSVRGVIDSDFVRYTGRSAYGELAGKPNELAGHWLPKIAAMSTTIPFETPLATTDWISSSPLGVGNPVLVFCKPYQIHRANKPEVLSDGDSVTVIAECLEVEASWFRQHVSEALELDSAKLREAVQALLDTDAARVVGMGSATGLVGQKLQSSGTQERTYPSEYDPPEIPSPQDLEDGLGWPPGSFPAPTAFMTRNVGFDVLATVDDFVSDRGQQLTVSCYRALDGGDVVTSELITPTGKVPMTTMPIFISASVDTTVYLHRGETILLGAMTPRAKDFEPILNKRWLMFLRLAK